jgi:hypothetical protein
MSGLLVLLPAHSPPWLLALAIVAFLVAGVIMAAVRVVRHIMPQHSSDRLAWWHERRAFLAERRKDRRRDAHPLPGGRSRRAACARAGLRERRGHGAGQNHCGRDRDPP